MRPWQQRGLLLLPPPLLLVPVLVLVLLLPLHHLPSPTPPFFPFLPPFIPSGARARARACALLMLRAAPFRPTLAFTC